MHTHARTHALGRGCTGQKSPNENGPVRQKLMTERIRKARFPFNTLNYSGLQGLTFALQIPAFSIPLLAPSIPPLSPSLQRENGPALGFGWGRSWGGGGGTSPMQSRRLSAVCNKARVQQSETNKNTGQERRRLGVSETRSRPGSISAPSEEEPFEFLHTLRREKK